jgi:hypothetical protein
MHNSKVDLLHIPIYMKRNRRIPRFLQILAHEGSPVIEPHQKSQPKGYFVPYFNSLYVEHLNSRILGVCNKDLASFVVYGDIFRFIKFT